MELPSMSQNATPQNGEGSMEQHSTSTALPKEILDDVTHLFNIYPPRPRMPYTQAFQNAQDRSECHTRYRGEHGYAIHLSFCLS